MEINQVSVETAVGWLSRGWGIFMRQPGIWVLFTIVMLALGIGLQLLPIVGSLAYALIMPALYAGMIYSAAQIDAGESVEFEDLFVGLARPEHRTPLLILGALSVAANILMLVVIFAVAGGSALMVAGTGGGDAAPAAMVGTMITAGLIGLVFGLLMAMAFVFSCPLVILGSVPPIEAIVTSFRASLSNIVPMLVVGVILLVAAFVASIPLALGWLVLIPVMAGAIYASYGDLFGSAAGDDAAPSTPLIEP